MCVKIVRWLENSEDSDHSSASDLGLYCFLIPPQIQWNLCKKASIEIDFIGCYGQVAVL